MQVTLNEHLPCEKHFRGCCFPAGLSPAVEAVHPILQMRKLSSFPLVSPLVGGSSWDKNTDFLTPPPQLSLFYTLPTYFSPSNRR